MHRTDVFVIGGGPAGLAAAIAARREGLRVVLADGNHPPIDKACGEGLMPDTRAAAAAIGVDIPISAGYELNGIHFQGGRHSARADFPHVRGLGMRRTALHGLLVSAAQREGVDIRWDTPVSGLDGIAARWIIGADGSRSRVRRWAGLDGDAVTGRFAYRRHFSVAPWSRYVEISWAEGCQVYVTPVAPDEVCVALISRNPRLRLDDALERYFPAVQDRLGDAPPASLERGGTTANVKLSAVARGNVALIGDASGSVDAITGEGIGLSFKQAALLARAMAGGNLAQYNRAHPGLALRPRYMAKMLLSMDRSLVIRQNALALLSGMPPLFRALLAIHVGA